MPMGLEMDLDLKLVFKHVTHQHFKAQRCVLAYLKQ